MRLSAHFISLVGIFLLGACFNSSGADAGPELPPCQAYCQVAVECEPGFFETRSECEADCQAEIEVAREDVSESCAASQSDLFACIGGLTSCEDYDAYWVEPVVEYPCFEEDERLYDSCE